MSAIKNYLLDQIYELSRETGYSDEFLMDTWIENSGEMTWEQFRFATLDREWIENNPLADVLWMITVSPDCKRPTVHCAELEKPYPFAVTIMARDFTGMPGLMAEALRKLDELRQGVA